MNARELINAMLVDDPDVRSIRAGSAGYRWLLAHVVEWAAGEASVLGDLPLQERSDLPPTLIIFSDENGNHLSSIDVMELNETGSDET